MNFKVKICLFGCSGVYAAKWKLCNKTKVPDPANGRVGTGGVVKTPPFVSKNVVITMFCTKVCFLATLAQDWEYTDLVSV